MNRLVIKKEHKNWFRYAIKQKSTRAVKNYYHVLYNK